MRINPGVRALVAGLLGVSLLLPLVAFADGMQGGPAETKVLAAPRATLASRPSFAPIAEALRATGRSDLQAVAIVSYDASGVVQAVRLDPGTGEQVVDDAIIAWCKAARLTPGVAGEGRLPFDLSADASLAASHAELPEIRTEHFVERPPMKDLIRTFVETGRTRGSLELGLEYSADGLITHVEVIRSSGNATLDLAAVDWTKRARLRAGNAGRGRLPFNFGLQ